MRVRWTVITALLFTLGCMCGAADDPVAPVPEVAVPASVPPAAPVAAPAPSAAPAGGRASYSAGLAGVCERFADCCGNKVAECRQELGSGSGAAAFAAPAVYRCITTTACDRLCDPSDQGRSCIEAWQAAESASSAAAHRQRMGIIQNYPSGGACGAGQTEVRDANGTFLRCE